MALNSQSNRALMLRSPQRRAVVECILSGYTDSEIAEELSIKIETVWQYKTLIARYYGIPKFTTITPHLLLYYILKPHIACTVDVTLLRAALAK